MKSIRMIMVLLAAAVTVAFAGCATKPSNIDPAADQALKKMSETIAGAQTISLRFVSMADEPVETGQMAQIVRDDQIVFKRPDMLAVDITRGNEKWAIWYKGTSLTILNKNTNTYATITVPSRVDKMLDYLSDNYDVHVPLADLFFPNPYQVLTEHVQSGTYVGEDLVEGINCDHLMFTSQWADWQIWIDKQKSLPCKILIDHKSKPGRPQFLATVSDFSFSAPSSEAVFDPVLPAGAKKVEMSELFGTNE